MRNFREKSLQLLALMFIFLFVLNFYLGQNYTIIAPGVMVDLKDIVTVERGTKDEGSFFLTTVTTRTLNVPLLIYAAVDPHVKIQRKEQVIPPGWTMKEYMDYMEKWMQESQKIAEYVALKKAGYNPQILGDGAQIVGIMPNSPSKGILFPGDIIRKVDNEPVSIADEVIEKVANRNIGEVVELEVEREDNTLTLSLPTIESQTEPGKAIVGIYITTLNWKPALPLNIEINTGKIGGPSAGCMFVLEILNQLTPEDLAQGRKIAGTGTISLDETIGEIGGVEQKVVAAYRAGAEIFIVPEKNAEAAMKAAKGYDIEVVSVKNLDDVLNYLEEL